MKRTKSILIVGGSGFLGTHLALALRERHKVFVTYYQHPVRIPGVTALPLNIDNRNWSKRIAYTTQPDAVIYLAGPNDILWAEKNPRDADRLHTGGAATISSVADIFHPKFIYVSSPLVFDGTRGNYKETDIVLPTSALGKAKLGGENYIRGRSLNYLILRTSPLLGRSSAASNLGSSLVDRLRMALDRGRRVELPNDELFSFAPVQGFCEAMAGLLESGVRNRVFHYGGLTRCTYFEMGKRFAERFGYDPALISPVNSVPESSFTDYSLNCSPLIESLRLRPYDLGSALDRVAGQS